MLKKKFSNLASSSLLLTDEQKEILLNRAKTIIIGANAGTGKTKTLASRVGKALANGVPPNRILVLTFTSEAKEVMWRYFRSIGIAYKDGSQIELHTFDEFAAKVLFNFDGYMPITISTSNALRNHVVASIKRVSDKFGSMYDGLEIATHNIAVSQFIDTQLILKASMRPHRDYDGMCNEDIAHTMDISLTHWLTFLTYERLRFGNFGVALYRGVFDATYDLASRLIESPELRASIPVYKLVICDELHDLNEAAFQILMALLSSKRTYFVGAGDKDQVIFSKLGADSQYLERRFKEYDPYLIYLPLTVTFRFGPHLALPVGEFKQKTSSSALDITTEIIQNHYQAGNYMQCAHLVVKNIFDWREKSKGQCAILIRDYHQSVYIENALMLAEIGYETVKMKKYLQREEILFMRGMIAIALNNLESVKSQDVRKAIVESLVTYGEVDFIPDIDHPEPLEFAKNEIAQDPFLLEHFFSGLILSSKSNACKRISEIVKFIQTLPQDAKADEVLNWICVKMNIDSLVRRVNVYPYEASVVSKSIEGFIDSARMYGKRLKEFSEWIGQLDDFPSKKKSFR
jgi:DNA helicase II / ATP-dependent DNA helicase PcrA